MRFEVVCLFVFFFALFRVLGLYAGGFSSSGAGSSNFIRSSGGAHGVSIQRLGRRLQITALGQRVGGSFQLQIAHFHDDDMTLLLFLAQICSFSPSASLSLRRCVISGFLMCFPNTCNCMII
jgi:hypothetical protein